MAEGLGGVSALEAKEGERSEPEGEDRALRGWVRAVDPEVLEKPMRRRFTAQYKLGILEEADRCDQGSGQLGALLRREGLYWSNLTTWRRQRDKGVLEERGKLRAILEAMRAVAAKDSNMAEALRRFNLL